MKDKSSLSAVASTNWSICGRGKLSFGHALFRSVKSTQTRHFPFFLLTTTGLASQSRYLTSVIDPTLRNFLTSSFTAEARSGPSFRLFCLTGLKVGSIFSSWHVMLMSIPGISSAAHANVLRFFLRQAMSSVLKGSRRLAPISTQRSGNASSRQIVTTGSQVGSHFSSMAAMLRDCQKSSAESRLRLSSLEIFFSTFLGVISRISLFRFSSAAKKTCETLGFP